MSWHWFATAVIGAALVLAPVSHARTGGGIYEPFPEPSSSDAGLRVVNRLIRERLAKPRAVTSGDLERGVVLAGASAPAAAAAATPSSRADAEGAGAADVLALAAVLGLAVAAVRLVRV